MPKVSIIIPVYNVESYLVRCLESALSQTYTNIEIILVNDESTDSSLSICIKYAEIDQRIRIIDQKNEGLSSARNSGVAIALGKYITFLDSDDWLELNAIEEAIIIAENGNYDLVFWQMIKEFEGKSIYVKNKIFDSNLAFDNNSIKILHRRLAGPISDELKYPFLIDSFATAWGKLYKTDLIRIHNLQFVDTKIIGSEDIFFNFQYFGIINNAFFLNKHLIHYRKDNLKSLTKTHGSTLAPRFHNLFRLIEMEIQFNSLNDDFKVGLKNRIVISMLNIGLSETSLRFNKNIFLRIKSIHEYLSKSEYKSAIRDFRFDFVPFPWNLFYFCCKIKFSLGVFILLKFMRLFIKS